MQLLLFCCLKLNSVKKGVAHLLLYTNCESNCTILVFRVVTIQPGQPLQQWDVSQPELSYGHISSDQTVKVKRVCKGLTCKVWTFFLKALLLLGHV